MSGFARSRTLVSMLSGISSEKGSKAAVVCSIWQQAHEVQNLPSPGKHRGRKECTQHTASETSACTYISIEQCVICRASEW